MGGDRARMLRWAPVAAVLVLFLLAGYVALRLTNPAPSVPAGGGAIEACDPALSPPLPLDSHGDSLYPNLGNAGYDVQHYTLDLAADPDAYTLSGTAAIRALAVQDLSTCSLDFHGFDIHSLTVDGRPADYQRDGNKLKIDLGSVGRGQVFTITVAYSGTPDPSTASAYGADLGWLRGATGTYVSSEPAGAENWFPVNDHPCDKATYTFRITVPKPYVVAANGQLAGTYDHGDTTTYLWEAREPLASYLASVNVGDFVLHSEEGPAGLPIRSYYLRAIAPQATAAFAQTAEQIAFFNSIFGPYPFEAYGVVVVDGGADTWAMENQTLSLFGRNVATDGSAATVAPHELAHQWFGDSVSLKSWRDIWLNEGFATYAEALWYEHLHGPAALEERMRAIYPGTGSRALFPPGNPPADDLFDTAVYDRGALTLHALRRQVGDAAFFAILRTYADRYRYGNASTDDLIAVANEVSGQDLQSLFQAWLYDEAIPAYPQPAPDSSLESWPLPQRLRWPTLPTGALPRQPRIPRQPS